MSRPSWTQKYIGWIWHFRGRTAPQVDCWGFIAEILNTEYGARVPDYSEFEIIPDDEFQKVMARPNPPFRKLEGEKPQEGDLIVVDGSSASIHVGVMLNRREFIHLERGRESRVDRTEDPWWRSKIIAFYRARKEADEAA